jgi:hypothetical protein
MEENFCAAFPEINIDNLPDNFANFQRIPTPRVGAYEVYEGVYYEWDGAFVKDVHRIRELTPTEKVAKQEAVHREWEENEGPASWVFNEELCGYEPPIPYPDDGNRYIWNEENLSWDLVPASE